jgi:hypothetical protein
MLPIEVIFNLLCVCRRGQAGSAQVLRRAMQRRGLFYGQFDDLPSLSFWLRLAQSVGLLDEQGMLRCGLPTLLADEWFSWTLGEQLASLLNAWLAMPNSERQREARYKLLEALRTNTELTPSLVRELPGLWALGIYEADSLTEIGMLLLNGQADPLENEPACPWQLASARLTVPYPPAWGLLWELEKFLDASAPGRYPLTQAAIRLALQRGDSGAFIQVLEIGLGDALPEAWLDKILRQPTIRLLPGQVLEFSEAEELLRLRQNPPLRRDLDEMLSPRHVHLQPWRAPVVMARLERMGMLVLPIIPPEDEVVSVLDEGETRSLDVVRLSKAERTHLAALLMLAEGLPTVNLAAPDGLWRKLTQAIEDDLLGAAARRASRALAALAPPMDWTPEIEPPLPPEEEVIAFLEAAVQKMEAVDVWYHVPRRPAPELRHITPLLIEQRGLRWYVTAYCHDRRANRLFRIDRLRLVN